MNFRVLSVLAVASAPLFSVAACSDDNQGTGASIYDAGVVGEAAAPVCAQAPAPVKPASACNVTLGSPPVPAANHLPEGTAIAYCSNPPSGGDHYPVWAAFQEYTSPVEWPYLVHSMEHGAVVLLYKCDAGGCPDDVAQLRTVRDNAAPDPLCAAGTKRIVIAPSATIPTKFAAAAWGKTYEADCIDLPTLEAFVRDNYAHGPENLCNPGRAF